MNKKQNIKNKVLKELVSFIKTISITVIVAFIVSRGIIVNAYIPTASMENTIMTYDRVIANRLAYILEEPKRGDIIVFKYPDDQSILYVKRIIGLPGDEIEIKDSIVYIDGIAYEEDYIAEEVRGEFGPYIVPDNNYFMMGDNRNNSKDSRMWDNTFLAEDDIVGKVIIRYYPSLKAYN